jgi:hypothetical protein
MPSPESASVEGELTASLVSVRVPVAFPTTCGVKATEKLSVALGARVSGAVKPVTVKPLPIATILVMFRVALPVLVRAAGWELVLPTTTSPKLIPAGFRVARGDGGLAPKTATALPLPDGLLVSSTEEPAGPPPHPAVSRLSDRRITQSPRAA